MRAPPTSSAQKRATEASGPKTKKGTKKGRNGFSRKKAQDTQKKWDPAWPTSLQRSPSAGAIGNVRRPWNYSSFSFLHILRLFAATQFPLLGCSHTGRTAAPILAAKKRRSRKKDGTAELLFHGGAGRRRHSKRGGKRLSFIHRWAAGFSQMGTRPRHDFLPPPCLLLHL